MVLIRTPGVAGAESSKPRRGAPRRGFEDSAPATPGVRIRTMSDPRATHDYKEGGLEPTLEFLKRTRSELRELRKVRVWKDRLEIFDVNGDRFEVRGLGYPDADIVALLNAVN